MKKYLVPILIAAVLIILGIVETPAQQANIPATTGTVGIAAGTTTISKIISGVSGKRVYITAVALIPVATAAVTFSTGTGTNCGTGTGSLTGVMTFSAGQILNWGTGNGALMVAGLGEDICITIATAGAPGVVAFSIF